MTPRERFLEVAIAVIFLISVCAAGLFGWVGGRNSEIIRQNERTENELHQASIEVRRMLVEIRRAGS